MATQTIWWVGVVVRRGARCNRGRHFLLSDARLPQSDAIGAAIRSLSKTLNSTALIQNTSILPPLTCVLFNHHLEIITSTGFFLSM